MVALLIVSMNLNVVAVERSTSYIPSLSFSGTTANCKVVIVSSGNSINATLQLWRGNTLVKSWYDSGTSRLIIRGTYNATSGQSYTLRAVGTVGGVPFTSSSITKTCP